MLLIPPLFDVESTAGEQVIDARKAEAACVLSWDGNTSQPSAEPQLDAAWPVFSQLSALSLAGSRRLVGHELGERRYLLVTSCDAESPFPNAVLEGIAKLRERAPHR